MRSTDPRLDRAQLRAAWRLRRGASRYKSLKYRRGCVTGGLELEGWVGMALIKKHEPGSELEKAQAVSFCFVGTHTTTTTTTISVSK